MPRRITAFVTAALELPAILAALLLGLILRPPPQHPERVTTQVVTCDVSSHGAAQVWFTIHNQDRYEHNYEVVLSVTTGVTPLGTNLNYGNWVQPGQTATVRALVPLTANASEATCTARAYVHDTHVGHRPR